MKYEYTCQNIYSGELYVLKSNIYYKKETILQGEYALKECIEIATGYCYYSCKFLQEG